MATTPRFDDLIAEAGAFVDRFRYTRPSYLIYRLADALEGAEAERDAALAVIEKARGMFQNDGFHESPLGRLLSSVPADVLRERDAEKWDEGWDASGEGWNGEYLPPGLAAPNPYRIEQNSEGNET